MKIDIITSNSVYKDEQCVGGYHEIHTVNYLQNVGHAIATINSVIKNNLMYGCSDAILESIEILCEDSSIKTCLEYYYRSYPCKVKVYVS